MFISNPDPSECSCRGTSSRRKTPKSKPKGVSVYYLRNHFLEEICAGGYSEKSTLDELEKWIYERSGDVICLRDGTSGASHVSCLKGSHIVGPASIRLSCAVENNLDEVITTLESFCESKDWNTKETYVWIDMLCQNLHRRTEDSHKQLPIECNIDKMSIGYTSMQRSVEEKKELSEKCVDDKYPAAFCTSL